MGVLGSAQALQIALRCRRGDRILPKTLLFSLSPLRPELPFCPLSTSQCCPLHFPLHPRMPHCHLVGNFLLQAPSSHSTSAEAQHTLCAVKRKMLKITELHHTPTTDCHHHHFSKWLCKHIPSISDEWGIQELLLIFAISILCHWSQYAT